MPHPLECTLLLVPIGCTKDVEIKRIYLKTEFHTIEHNKPLGSTKLRLIQVPQLIAMDTKN